jgi:chromosome segregation ATPase
MVAWKKLTVLGGVALLLVAVVSLAIRDASKTAQDRITSLERTKRALEFEKTQLVEQADALQDALTSAKNEASRMQRELSDASLKVRDAEGARLSVEAQLEDLQGKVRPSRCSTILTPQLEAAEGSLKTLKSEVDTSGHKLSESQLAEKQMKLNYAKLSSDLQQCVRDKEEKIAKVPPPLSLSHPQNTAQRGPRRGCKSLQRRLRAEGRDGGLFDEKT